MRRKKGKRTDTINDLHERIIERIAVLETTVRHELAEGDAAVAGGLHWLIGDIIEDVNDLQKAALS